MTFVDPYAGATPGNQGPRQPKAKKQTAGPLGLGFPNKPKLDPSYQQFAAGPVQPTWLNPSNYTPDNPETPANPYSRPDLNRRVYSLLQQGHQWLGLQTLYGLADSGLSDDDISTQAERLRKMVLQGSRASLLKPQLAGAEQGLQATKTVLESKAQYTSEVGQYGQSTPGVIGAGAVAVKSKQEILDKANDIIHAADDGFKHYWDDPMLQKNPSAGLAIKNYLSGVLGPPPVAGGSLMQMQKQLQVMGFGRDLPVDGTMHSPGWRGAMADWKSQVYKSQLKGDRPGSISVGHALQALNALTPTSAWDALVGYVKQLPDGLRTLAADFTGSVAGLSAGLIQGTSEGDPLAFMTEKKGTSWQRSAHGDVASSVNNFLGGERQTPESNVQDFQENFGQHLLEDSINVIMLSSMLGAGSRFFDAYGLEKAAADTGSEAASTLTREAAYQGPGVVARAGSKLPDTWAFKNIPLLGRTSPVLEGLADETGWYYKVRAFTHTPYTWMSPAGSAVRLADVAFQKSLLLGAEAQGLGQLEQTFTGNDQAPFAQSVMETQSIDHINDAIGQRLGIDVFGQHIKPNINDLQFVFGGRGAAALHQSSSSEVGRLAQAGQEGMSQALGETGIQASIERALGMGWRKIVKQYGGSDKVHALFWPEIYHQGANMMAVDRFNRERMELGLAAPALSDWERILTTRKYEHEILADPDQATAAVAGLLSQAQGKELFVRLKTDILRNPEKYEPGYLQSKLAAEAHVRSTLLEHHGNLLGVEGEIDPDFIGIIPKGRLVQQDAYEFNAMMKARLDDIENRAAFDPDEYQYALAQNEEQRTMHDPGRDVGLGPGVADHPHPQEWNQWEDDMNHHLLREYLVDGDMMPHRRFEKLTASQRFADELPVELHAGDNPILQAHIDELDKMGWKLVHSNDISHSVSAMAGTTNDFTGKLKFRRRAMESIGLSPDAIDDSSVGQLANLGRLQELRKIPQEELGVLTPESILIIARRKGFLPEQSSVGGRMQHLFGGKTRLEERLGVDAAQQAMDTMPIQAMGRRAFVKAIRDPENTGFQTTPYYDAFNRAVEAQGYNADWNHVVSEAAANHIYTALQRGSNYPPAYMVGAAHIEELFKNAGSANFMGIKHLTPDNGMGWAMANMPRTLINFRNKIRFDYSPMFSFRRWYKTNVKMLPFGIPPVVHPIKTLVENGEWEAAKQALMDAKPDVFKAEALNWIDPSVRYLRDQDVFGLYNRMGFEAHAAFHMRQAGLSPSKIGENLDKIFTYGSRSAMEKSINFVFFPFSFEKSLYKIMGGYMLDHPAQRYLITQGMAAYDRFNKDHMDGSNPLATEWWNRHAPLMSEASRINAFTAGISLGQPGGINRPLLDIFLPKSWSPSAANYSLLEQYVPAVRDFGRIYDEALQQKDIGFNTISNISDAIGDKKHNIFMPAATTLSPNADLDEGFKMNLMLNNRLKQNIINGDKFPVSPEYGDFAGQPITKQALREITSLNHPAYGAEGASTYVIATTQAFDNYKNKQRGTPGPDGQFHNPPKFPDGIPKYRILNKFQEAVNSLAYDLRNGPATKDLAAQTDSLRKAAQYMAENDSEFYKLYNSVFARTLGPLEGISK